MAGSVFGGHGRAGINTAITDVDGSRRTAGIAAANQDGKAPIPRSGPTHRIKGLWITPIKQEKASNGDNTPTFTIFKLRWVTWSDYEPILNSKWDK